MNERNGAPAGDVSYYQWDNDGSIDVNIDGVSLVLLHASKGELLQKLLTPRHCGLMFLVWAGATATQVTPKITARPTSMMPAANKRMQIQKQRNQAMKQRK